MGTTAIKMNKKVIKIPRHIEFLSDAMENLPIDSLFNKGRIGGGGTTIALKNNAPTIICVPFVALIENKVSQSQFPGKKHIYPHEIIGIYGNRDAGPQEPGENLIRHLFKVEDLKNPTYGLKEYLATHEVPKIVVTYDSLHKVLPFINSKDFHLLIDEYHLLFTEYGYRDKAIRDLLRYYKMFGSFTFMTSTPIEEEFLFDELKDLPIYEADWEDKRPIVMRGYPCKGKEDGPKGINTVMSATIQNCLTLKDMPNLYIFVNSVKFIQIMIERNDLKPENCRVIISKNNLAKLPNGIARGGTLDSPKRINFLTSTAFEGADIYDENGYTIIVSNGNAAHTLLDISTKVKQIAGRIRDTAYNNYVDHIYSVTRYSGKMTEAQFVAKIDDREKEEKAMCEALRSMADVGYMIKGFKKYKPLYHYITPTNEIVYDPMKKKIDFFNFRLANNVYNTSVNVMAAHKNSGFEANTFEAVVPLGSDNFKDTVENLLAHKTKFTEIAPSYLKMKETAFSQYTYLQEALERIGFEGIKKANYQTNNIKRALGILKNKNSLNKNYNEIAKLLHSTGKFGNDQVIPSKEAKEILQEIYDGLSITKMATASQLKGYYHIREKSVRIGTSVVQSMHILTPKFKLN